ncbi:MAG: hypothetical protein LBN09_00285 [Clostridioides sp.]|jgi:hypothetical protein|nr:hypothetical protein [Clostridioides sp.]
MFVGNGLDGIYNRLDVHEHVKERVQSFNEMHLLVIIVSHSKEKKVTDILRAKHMPSQFVFHAEGTATSTILDCLGIGSEVKAVILGFAVKAMIPEILRQINEKLKIVKKGMGVAFSIPLSGIMMPALASDEEALKNIQKNFESEANQVNENLTHDLIVILVDEGKIEDVMDAARNAGATGGTTFRALRIGMKDAARFFGISIQEKKEVVTILTERDNKAKILNAVNEALGKTHKVMFALPADNVMGIGEPRKPVEK